MSVSASVSVSVGGGGGACVHVCKHNLKRHICTQKSEFSDIQVQGIKVNLSIAQKLPDFRETIVYYSISNVINKAVHFDCALKAFELK